ncbi:MAG: CinA family protein, partial [Hyphomicrobium sp.]|nr:CinA family protein [Hyphomicrobium sp.]
MFDENLIRTAEALLATLRARKLMLATAESCTGGLIVGVLTEIAGSSDVVERGFVTYSNEAKTELIGVPAEMIAAHGAVSKEVALAMAAGAHLMEVGERCDAPHMGDSARMDDRRRDGHAPHYSGIACRVAFPGR